MIFKFFFGQSRTCERLDALAKQLSELEKNLMSKLDELVAKVREQGDVVSSAVVLISGFSAEIADLKAKLEEAGIDAAVVDSLVAELDSYGDKLAEAVAANTVADAPAQPAGE